MEANLRFPVFPFLYSPCFKATPKLHQKMAISFSYTLSSGARQVPGSQVPGRAQVNGQALSHLNQHEKA